jgi:hypothetical protein
MIKIGENFTNNMTLNENNPVQKQVFDFKILQDIQFSALWEFVQKRT